MQVQVKPPSGYYWGEFLTRLKDPTRDMLFLSYAAWCRHYGFSRKTLWALIHGTYVSGAGPKISAIIRQAQADGLIDEIKAT